MLKNFIHDHYDAGDKESVGVKLAAYLRTEIPMLLKKDVRQNIELYDTYCKKTVT